MDKIEFLKQLVNHFDKNKKAYKSDKYNEHSCRDEFINPFLEILGWDVTNKKGLAPQFREVIAEYHANSNDRPDYSLTLRGVAKIFVEAKKPYVDISKDSKPAVQTRKYGWNANHKVSILTNFEYFIIYDTTTIPNENDNCAVSRYCIYHYTEYIEKIDEISRLVSRDSVYSGDFDRYFNEKFNITGSHKQQVDVLFLSQINKWRIDLSNELYSKGGKYASLNVLNDVVQEFINQIVFIRICEDKNLPLYHHLKDTISDADTLHRELERLFREADKRYNSGIFSGEYIIFDLNNHIIADMIKGLYYPQSPYMFNIIEPNMLGKIYEMFLTEQLTVLDDGTIGLAQKKECLNRSVVTTPTEIVKYMVEKTLSRLCADKTPDEICELHIADIACGSGVFLEEVFQYLQSYCIEWYIHNNKSHLIEIDNGGYKLPLEEKKKILCSCIYGVDIDIHAVEVAKFSLLIKLIENETAPSVQEITPILPDLSTNILHGNSLISDEELTGIKCPLEQLVDIVPFNWNELNCNQFDAIVGNPPYVNIEDIKKIIPGIEQNIYEKKYKSPHNRYDKYFLFIERALDKISTDGYVCYIVPNKFIKNKSGRNLRKIISEGRYLISIDDFGAEQLFDNKTVYNAIILFQKKENTVFRYTDVKSPTDLWLGKKLPYINVTTSSLNEMPWRLSSDFEILEILKKIEPFSVPMMDIAFIFNGIQTSAEQPPIYWFSEDEIIDINNDYIIVNKSGKEYKIERSILRPYFKPTKLSEKGRTTYDILETKKLIIFPYDDNGNIYDIDTMKTVYPNTFYYLEDHKPQLLPRTMGGKRDVKPEKNVIWYQYGRKQSLTVFNNKIKLIVKVNANKLPMYALDANNFLTASGDTAGYCGVAEKEESKYKLEYIQAWLNNSYTQRIIKITGTDFDKGFVARGKSVLDILPFVKLDFDDPRQKAIYDEVVENTHNIYDINEKLNNNPSKQNKRSLLYLKTSYIQKIEELISKVYRLEF